MSTSPETCGKRPRDSLRLDEAQALAGIDAAPARPKRLPRALDFPALPMPVPVLKTESAAPDENRQENRQEIRKGPATLPACRALTVVSNQPIRMPPLPEPLTSRASRDGDAAEKRVSNRRPILVAACVVAAVLAILPFLMVERASNSLRLAASSRSTLFEGRSASNGQPVAVDTSDGIPLIRPVPGPTKIRAVDQP